jgi:hypothetical protein
MPFALDGKGSTWPEEIDFIAMACPGPVQTCSTSQLAALQPFTQPDAWLAFSSAGLKCLFVILPSSANGVAASQKRRALLGQHFPIDRKSIARQTLALPFRRVKGP